MLTDPSAFAADREARNEYLIEIDEAWELCRDAVEGARTNYETELDSSRGVFEWERAQASSVHGEALDVAWAKYKSEVGVTSARSRREVMAEARASYDLAVAELRKAYEERIGIAREGYVHRVEDARTAYEAAVDEALGSHRAAVHGVDRYLEPGEHAVAGEPVGPVAPSDPAVGGRHEGFGTAPEPASAEVVLPWQSSADAESHDAEEHDPGQQSVGPEGSVDGSVSGGVLAELNGSPSAWQ